MIQDSSVLSLSEGVSYQPLGEGEGAVVLVIDSGQLFTCNDTTSAFLAAIDGKRRFADLVRDMLESFDVSADQLRDDLTALAIELQQEGVVRIQ